MGRAKIAVPYCKPSTELVATHDRIRSYKRSEFLILTDKDLHRRYLECSRGSRQAGWLRGDINRYTSYYGYSQFNDQNLFFRIYERTGTLPREFYYWRNRPYIIIGDPPDETILIELIGIRYFNMLGRINGGLLIELMKIAKRQWLNREEKVRNWLSEVFEEYKVKRSGEYSVPWSVIMLLVKDRDKFKFDPVFPGIPDDKARREYKLGLGKISGEFGAFNRNITDRMDLFMKEFVDPADPTVTRNRSTTILKYIQNKSRSGIELEPCYNKKYFAIINEMYHRIVKDESEKLLDGLSAMESID